MLTVEIKINNEIIYRFNAVNKGKLDKYISQPEDERIYDINGGEYTILHCRSLGALELVRQIIKKELITNNGKRIIAKHKNDEFRETTEKRKIVDLEKLKVLKNAKEIADEWVTDMRLTHVISIYPTLNITDTGSIIKDMIEDVKREAEGEVIWSKFVEKAIGKKTAIIFKDRLKRRLK